MKIPKFTDILPFHFAKVTTFNPINREVKIFNSDSADFDDMPNEAKAFDEKIQ